MKLPQTSQQYRKAQYHTGKVNNEPTAQTTLEALLYVYDVAKQEPRWSDEELHGAVQEAFKSSTRAYRSLVDLPVDPSLRERVTREGKQAIRDAAKSKGVLHSEYLASLSVNYHLEHDAASALRTWIGEYLNWVPMHEPGNQKVTSTQMHELCHKARDADFSWTPYGDEFLKDLFESLAADPQRQRDMADHFNKDTIAYHESIEARFRFEQIEYIVQALVGKSQLESS